MNPNIELMLKCAHNPKRVEFLFESTAAAAAAKI